MGGFDRIYKEEVSRQLLPITKAAEILSCCESTARKRLRKADVRFIVMGRSFRYFAPDITKAKALHNSKAVDKEAAQ